EASGYQIKKMFEKQFSHFQAASFGSIYPALAKLTEQGLVSFREETQEKRPTKKVFTITPSGQKQFVDTLCKTEPQEQYRSDFMVLMTFAHLLPTERLREVLDCQTNLIQKELETLQAILNNKQPLPAGMRFTLEYGITANQSLLVLMQQRRTSLLDEIEEEKR
ncbi:MAG: helix-turn-helix transcriptional regulator, partial [Candidatus Sedimenticola sp. (ex Thyasira tokunagai)]